MTIRSVADFRKRLMAWYARNRRAMPWRKTRDAYRVWVSEIMLQQTRVAAVLPYYRRFVKRFPTVRALARARREDVLKLWAGLGYYSRARNLHRAAKKIVAKHDGKFPRDYEAALALPGVGRYTAAAVLSIAYGEPLAVVDGNVARVVARLGGMRGDVRANGRWKQIEKTAQRLMGERQSADYADFADSDGRHRRRQDGSTARSKLRARKRRQAAALHTGPGEWNQAMMELGATLCTPRAPRCGECPVARWCKARKLGIAERIPAARTKRATERIEIGAAVLLDPRGRTLLVKPEHAETNGFFSGMWQFPAVHLKGVTCKEKMQELLEPQSGFRTPVESAGLLIPEINADERGWGKKRGKDLAQRAPRSTEDTESLAGEMGLIALPVAKHSVTFREITLRPYLVRVGKLPVADRARAIALKRVAGMAVSSATKKIARTAEKAVQADK